MEAQKRQANTQTNLAHLHGQFHTPPGLRRRLNTLRRTLSHLPCALGTTPTHKEQNTKETHEVNVAQTLKNILHKH